MQLQEIGVFSKFALRCFFGELGDKTFFVAVLLAAWVATWDGLCAGWQQRQHQLMVLAGVLAGLVLHAVLVSVHLVSVTGSSAFSFAGVVLLVAMGTRLHLDLRKVQLRDAQQRAKPDLVDQAKQSEEAWNPRGPTVGTPAQTAWNSMAFQATAPPTIDAPAADQQALAGPGSKDYGSTTSSEAAVPAWVKEPNLMKPSEEKGTPIGTLLMAGIVSMVMIFVIEVGEKSQFQLLASGELWGASLVVSSLIGYIFATGIAVLIGYYMESMLDDKWLLFVAEMGFFAMGLVCFSQAVLGLGFLSIGKTAALLGFSSATGTQAA